MCYLRVSTVHERVVHRELVRIGMTYEAAVRKTEGTFSEAEIVSYDAQVEVCILILCQELSEEIEPSVEAVVESNLVNAPVAPVLYMLDSCRICVKAESYKDVLEFSLYVLYEYRRIESESFDAHIIHGVYEFTYLFTHYRVYLVLIH